MTFWTASSILLISAALFVLLPLWKRRNAHSFESEEVRKNANIALFHERNNELEAELAAGTIDQAQFEALVMELQQNLLADVSDGERDEIVNARHGNARYDNGQPDLKAGKSSRFGTAFMVPIVLVLLLPTVAFLLYQQWGYREDVELMGLFERTVNNTDDPEEARDLIYALGEEVQQRDDQPWPRYFLAENLALVGLFEQAQRFYEEAAGLIEDGPDKAVILGRVATAMYVNADFELTPEIRAVTDEALQLNPNAVSVLQLLATDAEQHQDYEQAIAYWRRLIQVNPNSRQADSLRGNIAEAQRLLGETDTDVASGPGTEPESGPAPALDVSVSLATDLQLDENLRVFIAARNAERAGTPPLAVVALTVADLPATVTLDDSAAMVGAFNLSSAQTVNVSALVSFAGTATPQSGDYRVQSEDFNLDGENSSIELVISEQVP